MAPGLLRRTGEDYISDGTAGTLVSSATISTHKKKSEMIEVDFRRVLSKKQKGRIQQKRKRRKK